MVNKGLAPGDGLHVKKFVCMNVFWRKALRPINPVLHVRYTGSRITEKVHARFHHDDVPNAAKVPTPQMRSNGDVSGRECGSERKYGSWEPGGTGIGSAKSLERLGRLMGFEPTTPGTTNQCSNQLSYSRRASGLRHYERSRRASRDG